ncbi:MAG: hypothetical protein AB7I27_15240 [Bacteriovoracaceae bacterium]
MKILMLFLMINLTHAAKSPNCLIKITNTLKTDVVQVDEFQFNLKNKAECQKTAESYKINTAPEAIKKREVQFEFGKIKPALPQMIPVKGLKKPTNL